MKLKWKKLSLFVAIPLLLGALVGWLAGSFKGFFGINTPTFAPPRILFPIVWSILYILMGVSRYIIDENGADEGTIRIYNIQLAVNLLWSFFFFTFKWYLFSFLWIILLIILVVVMITRFYPLSKVSSYIQLPYLLWIIFAAVLNFAIFRLN